MITLVRLNNEEILINPFQVESMEAGSDTCVTLMNGKRLFVQESVDEVKQLITNWFHSIYRPNLDGGAS